MGVATDVAESALVLGVRVAVDGEEVRQALAKFVVVGRLGRKVREYEVLEDLGVQTAGQRARSAGGGNSSLHPRL